MTKTDNRPNEKMQLTIEFADNGIILRNPDCEDEVTLALAEKAGYGNYQNIDHTEEYKTIGKKVYDWLTEVVVCDYASEWYATGAELDIVATLTGRKI